MVAMRDAALNGDTAAYDIIEGITTEIGPRMAGTEAEARARSWGLAKLTALGFKNVRIETTRMRTWVRGVETAEVVSPFSQKLRLTALGGSGATSTKGLTAPIVSFPSFAELQAAARWQPEGKDRFCFERDGGDAGRIELRHLRTCPLCRP